MSETTKPRIVFRIGDSLTFEQAEEICRLMDRSERLTLEMEQTARLRTALERIICTDCKNGWLFKDSLLFDLDREDEPQRCPNCRIRTEALGLDAPAKLEELK